MSDEIQLLTAIINLFNTALQSHLSLEARIKNLEGQAMAFKDDLDAIKARVTKAVDDAAGAKSEADAAVAADDSQNALIASQGDRITALEAALTTTTTELLSLVDVLKGADVPALSQALKSKSKA